MARPDRASPARPRTGGREAPGGFGCSTGADLAGSGGIVFNAEIIFGFGCSTGTEPVGSMAGGAVFKAELIVVRWAAIASAASASATSMPGAAPSMSSSSQSTSSTSKGSSRSSADGELLEAGEVGGARSVGGTSGSRGTGSEVGFLVAAGDAGWGGSPATPDDAEGQMQHRMFVSSQAFQAKGRAACLTM